MPVNGKTNSGGFIFLDDLCVFDNRSGSANLLSATLKRTTNG